MQSKSNLSHAPKNTRLNRVIGLIERIIFRHRLFIVCVFALFTAFFSYQASQIKLDASFNKNIPLEHDYMQTYLHYQQDFGGANRILVSLCDKSGSIYNGDFFKQLKRVHDQLFFIDGIDRVSLRSLYSPAVRFTEVVEDGFAGGPVVPASFKADKQGLALVKRNVEKSSHVGRLVANDNSCAMVSANILNLADAKVDTLSIAASLENDIRTAYTTETVSIHIIGFTKMVGDVADGAKGVVSFFVLAIVITFVFVYLFCRSFILTLFPILCSLLAMVWKIGILSSLGFGIDPMSILLPFLIFAIGVSHGVQMINTIKTQMAAGASSQRSSQKAFHALAVPGLVALLSDSVGFLTLLSIDIGIIKELALSASIGVGMIILSNLVLLPVLVSLLSAKQVELIRHRASAKQQKALFKASDKNSSIWSCFGIVTRRCYAYGVVGFAFILFVFSYIYSQQLKIGDLQAGSPVLHESSIYNQDTFLITEKYAVSADILSIIVKTKPDACTSYKLMSAIDQFQWRLANIEGVQSTISLSSVAKIINAGYNEGNPKWRVLSSNTDTLAQSVARVPTTSGLLNGDCSVMPIMLFLNDHKATTIDRVIAAVNANKVEFDSDEMTFLLASGPVGVMAATNQAVSAAQLPMMVYIYAAVIILCLLSFRSIKATLAVVLPLYLVSSLAQSLMTALDIGLTVYTLPVIALGVGIGVDYGIYILSTMTVLIRQGQDVQSAYLEALVQRGSAVIFTALTLAVGVSTWFFSALKFQVDMGIMLTFMFLVNMLGAIIILPALASLFWPNVQSSDKG